MAQNELPPISEIETKLANALFRTLIAEGKSAVIFSPDLQKKYGGGLHSPLQQLSNFYEGWNSLLPPPEEKIKELWERKIVNPDLSKNGVFVYDQLQGSPADIFLSLTIDKDAEKQVVDTVKNAAEIMLFGAISIPSVVETVTWLKTKGFRGKLTVFDISAIPVEVARIYKQFGLLPNGFDIEFVQTDVLSLPHSTPKADLIISDVLGYYLTPDQYEALKESVQNTLAKGGLWATRELVEPQGAPKPEDRSVLRLTPQERINGFNNFVERLLKVRLPIEDIQQFQNTRWIMVDTYARRSGNDYFGMLPKELHLEKNISISSKGLIQANHQRIFETSIIKKR